MPAAILQQSFNTCQGLAGVSATHYWQAAAIVAALGMGSIIPALFGVGNAPDLASFALDIAALILFSIGWGFLDIHNMPILCQIARPEVRDTGYGIMNFVSISCGGLANWGFGLMRDREIPLNAIFGVFAAACMVSVVLVLPIRPCRAGTV